MNKWDFFLLLVGIPFIVFLAFLGAGFIFTSSSYFCANCHEMSTQYVSWTRSTHKAVPCLECHSEPGFIGEIKAHINGSSDLFKHLTKLYSRDEISLEIKDASCRICHKGIKEKDEEFRNIHLNHSKVKIDCIDCHAGLVHGDIGGGFLYQKASCKHCHPELAVSKSESQ